MRVHISHAAIGTIYYYYCLTSRFHNQTLLCVDIHFAANERILLLLRIFEVRRRDINGFYCMWILIFDHKKSTNFPSVDWNAHSK